MAAVPGSDHAERLGDAGHGAGGAHDRAGAGGGREVALDLGDLGGARPRRRGSVAQKRRQSVQAPSRSPWYGRSASAPPRAWIAGTSGGRGAHELGRHRLVAAAHQHDGVHRLGADHLLGVDRHEVAEFQAGRAAGRPRRARSVGNSIGRPPAASTPRFTASSSSGKWRWQLLKPLRRLRDADHRPREHLARIAHRLRERAAQIEREIAVAVVGEAVCEARRRVQPSAISSRDRVAHIFVRNCR